MGDKAFDLILLWQGAGFFRSNEQKNGFNRRPFWENVVVHFQGIDTGITAIVSQYDSFYLVYSGRSQKNGAVGIRQQIA